MRRVVYLDGSKDLGLRDAFAVDGDVGRAAGGGLIVFGSTIVRGSGGLWVVGLFGTLVDEVSHFHFSS
jgi:hypothetical protein